MNEIITKDNTLSYTNIEDIGNSLTEKNPSYDYSPDFTIDNKNSGRTVSQLQEQINKMDISTIWADAEKKEDQQIIEKKLKRVYNLSIVDITKKVLSTIVDITTDLTNWMNTDKKLNEFIDIFIKKDRLIYIGILSVVIAFILFFISSTSGEIQRKSSQIGQTLTLRIV